LLQLSLYHHRFLKRSKPLIKLPRNQVFPVKFNLHYLKLRNLTYFTIWGKSVEVFMIFDRTYNQTDIKEITSVYIDTRHKNNIVMFMFFL